MANEKRLIDADALMKQFYSYYDCVNEFTGKNGYRGDTLMDYEVADMIYNCIENAPTVDAVEVVRCEDCKWYKEMSGECMHEYWQDAEGWDKSVDENGFCHLGERCCCE